MTLEQFLVVAVLMTLLVAISAVLAGVAPPRILIVVVTLPILLGLYALVGIALYLRGELYEEQKELS